ncbi:MAG TPA: Hsp20/alpha crystallin family protein [bacterium]|jgi:HSP20 family protein|nr:Hsp20/alpha crystallin family protein [bacterium]
MFMLPIQRESADARDTYRDSRTGFEQLFRLLDGEAVGRAGFSPALDVKETKDAYTVLADLPGLEKKDIEVSVEEGVLTVSGSRKAEHQEEAQDKTWHRVERRWGGFERSLKLGEGVDASKVAAEYKDGVLTITVQKKESALPRKIEVQ